MVEHHLFPHLSLSKVETLIVFCVFVTRPYFSVLIIFQYLLLHVVTSHIYVFPFVALTIFEFACVSFCIAEI